MERKTSLCCTRPGEGELAGTQLGVWGWVVWSGNDQVRACEESVASEREREHEDLVETFFRETPPEDSRGLVGMSAKDTSADWPRSVGSAG